MEIARTLQRYLDGELDEPARARVAGHLAVCRRCGLDEQAFRDIKDALARHEGVAAEPIERLRAFATAVVAGPPGPLDLRREGSHAPSELVGQVRIELTTEGL